MYTSAKELLLKKGQTGIYEIARGELILKNEINVNSISYATKTFSFNDISFADAVVFLEDAFSVDIKFDSKKFNDCRITAEFANKPLTYILEVINATLNTTYIQQGNTYSITGEGCQ
jgi:transmembrane sensor